MQQDVRLALGLGHLGDVGCSGPFRSAVRRVQSLAGGLGLVVGFAARAVHRLDDCHLYAQQRGVDSVDDYLGHLCLAHGIYQLIAGFQLVQLRPITSGVAAPRNQHHSTAVWNLKKPKQTITILCTYPSLPTVPAAVAAIEPSLSSSISF